MFDNYSKNLKIILEYARREAYLAHAHFIGTEHLLLAILRVKDSVAERLLRELGVSYESFKKQLKVVIATNMHEIVQPSPTNRVRSVIGITEGISLQLGSRYVGSEHLLAAIALEGKGKAMQGLEKLAVKPEQINLQLDQELKTSLPEGFSFTKLQLLDYEQEEIDETLAKYSTDLTERALLGELDPVIGREKEITRMIQVLSRRTKNNPLLIGEPGVGKTAVVEGLAQAIEKGRVPENLLQKRIMVLDLPGMLAGAKYRGEFEERLKNTLEDAQEDKDVLLFIDEIHTIIGAGSSEGSVDAANILKPILARGDLQCIGATTRKEYIKYFEKDSALERRFQPVVVDEPDEEKTIAILHTLRENYEKHHGVEITDEAIYQAVRLTNRFIADRYQPDKAIDVIDEGAARVRLRGAIKPMSISKLENELTIFAAEKDAAIDEQKFEVAAKLRDQERKLKQELLTMNEAWVKEVGKVERKLTADVVAEIVSEWSKVPVTRLTIDETAKLRRLEEELHKRVIGQDEAIIAVSKALRRARSGLKDAKRPVGSFIFLGPTGVGKTELAKALAEIFFSDEKDLVRFDMSEYMEKFAVSRLIGAPPGYVGYEEAGQLTEAVRKNPHTVILFDEIEKAHPDVFNLLLQVLDDGRLTDAKGRTVDFRNALIIMTSNLGAKEAKKHSSMGFGIAKNEDKENYARMQENMLEAVKKAFRPEFVNRLDGTIVFHWLTKDEILQIVELFINDVNKRLQEKNLSVHLSDAAKEYLAELGFDENFGARPLKRAIVEKIEDPLVDYLLAEDLQAGKTIEVSYNEEKKLLEFQA
ncbi:MAG: ATP-dependent Clp protease ATP-binding subunit [Clostridia bacterium]